MPQRGVAYGADGNPTVVVVTPDNKVELIPVTGQFDRRADK